MLEKSGGGRKLGTGHVQVYYGAGRGKTNAALGNALRAASEGRNAYVIKLLKGEGREQCLFMKG